MTRAAVNCAGAYRAWAERTGHRTALWPDLSVADMSVGGSCPVDSACLLAPARTPEELSDVVDRAESVFALGSGGPIQIWSAWPTPDLGPRGYRAYRVPGMIRPAGGQARSAPAELQVRPARQDRDFAAAAALIDEIFDVQAPEPARLLTAATLGADLEVFLGWVQDRAVATATAFVSDGFCGVYAVATSAQARGRGYGEALTWAATRFRAELPATLQASELGLPVYQRMGYRTFGHFTLWEGPRPPGPPGARP